MAKQQDFTKELFKGKKQIRQVQHNNQWYYSVVDVCDVLAEPPNASAYWRNLKRRLKEEGADPVQIGVVPLKLKWADGRMRETDTANRETLLRLIQSIPSKKAEPFKSWLATVGEQRLEEGENPELALERLRDDYRRKGYDDKWIDTRIQNFVTRNMLTDEWKERGAKSRDYGNLTGVLHETTFGLTIQEHKALKALADNHNLREHSTTLELALQTLAEATATRIHQTRDSQGVPQLTEDVEAAGKIASNTRKQIEAEIGQPVATSHNFLGQPKPKKTRKLPPSQPSLFDIEAD